MKVIGRSICLFVLSLVVLAPNPAMAQTWKANGKVDAAAANATIQSMRGFSNATLSRAKDADNSFGASGTATTSSTKTTATASGTWGLQVKLDKITNAVPKKLAATVNLTTGEFRLDYDAISVDKMWPLLWGICGPKVAFSGKGSVGTTSVGGKLVPTLQITAECSGQVGCGAVVAGCKVAWVGGGLYAKGTVGVRACSGTRCVESFVNGSFGPTFEVSGGCGKIVVFSWKDSWVSGDRVLTRSTY